MPHTTDIDRLPPHSIEAEKGVLGCVLLAGAEAKGADIVDQCQERIRGELDFFERRHQILWSVMVGLHVDGKGLDAIAISDRLRERDVLGEIGGMAYLAELQDATPSSANLPHYLGIVSERATQRRLIAAASHVVTLVHQAQAPVTDQVAAAQQAILEVSESGHERRIVGSKEAAKEAVTTIERLWTHRGKGLQDGLTTGLSFLDKRLGGIGAGQVFYVGAPQSTGKTSLLLTMMRHMTVTCSIPIGFMSVESRLSEVYMRMLCNMARVNWAQARSGFISEADVRAFQAHLPALSKAPWHIVDQGALTPTQLRRYARRLVKQHGCKAIFIDHFHRMSDPEARDPRMEANSIVRGIRWVASELEVPVIVAAQVSREAKKEAASRGSRKPQATDIRESAAIEEDADIMGILAKDFPNTQEDDYRQSGFDPDGDNWPMNLEIVKQRNGPTGPVELTFQRPFFRYEDRHLGTGSVEGGERKKARLAQETEQDLVDVG
jgi:replicative DNA helicase